MITTADGHTVRITHYRILDELAQGLNNSGKRLRDLGLRVGGVMTKDQMNRRIPSKGYKLNSFSPSGGFTVAEVVSIEEGEEKVLARGEACCRADEQFNRKIGREVAIGRALNKLAENKPQEVKVVKGRGVASLAFADELNRLMRDFNLSFEDLGGSPEEVGRQAAVLAYHNAGRTKRERDAEAVRVRRHSSAEGGQGRQSSRSR